MKEVAEMAARKLEKKDYELLQAQKQAQDLQVKQIGKRGCSLCSFSCFFYSLLIVCNRLVWIKQTKI